MDNIWDKFRSWFGFSQSVEFDVNNVPTKLLMSWLDSSVDYAVRDLAFETAVSKIAKSLSKTEIKTYINNKEVKKLDYYRLNYQPNRNQNGSMWMHKLVSQLLRTNEALIIDIKGNLLIADNFNKDVRALIPWIFSGVMVDELVFDRTFTTEDSMYISLNNSSIKSILDNVYSSYSKMMSSAREILLAAGGTKGILSMDGLRTGTPEDKDKAKEIIEKQVRPLWESRHAVITLPKGWEIKDIQKEHGWSGSRDYRAMIDDIYDLTAIAFSIPPILLKGQVAGIDEIYNVYLTDCIDPIAGLISNELTRYLYSRESILSGGRVLVDTSKMKHFDLFESASAIEKLIGSGVMTINELRERIGYKPAADDVGNKHFITKNFGTSKDAVKDGEGKNED